MKNYYLTLLVGRRILKWFQKWNVFPIELRHFQPTPALETLFNTEKYLSSGSDEDTRTEVRFGLPCI